MSATTVAAGEALSIDDTQHKVDYATEAQQKADYVMEAQSKVDYVTEPQHKANYVTGVTDADPVPQQHTHHPGPHVSHLSDEHREADPP